MGARKRRRVEDLAPTLPQVPRHPELIMAEDVGSKLVGLYKYESARGDHGFSTRAYCANACVLAGDDALFKLELSAKAEEKQGNHLNAFQDVELAYTIVYEILGEDTPLAQKSFFAASVAHWSLSWWPKTSLCWKIYYWASS